MSQRKISRKLLAIAVCIVIIIAALIGYYLVVLPSAGIFYLFQGHIEPVSAFGISWTMLLMIAVIIGGIGTLEGPIIGSALAVFFQQVLARYVGISLIIEGGSLF